MSNFYAACDLGTEAGRVMLGTLHKGELTISEIRRFQNLPVKEKGSLHWNIPQLYQEILDGLREIGKYEEPVASVSCTAWDRDYLLFTSDGSLIPPSHQADDARSATGMDAVLSKIAWPVIYEETGVQHTPGSTLFQLGAEKPRRLRQASHLMPVADGFNYLLSGVPSVEMSSASATQLYSPASNDWSEPLVSTLGLPRQLLPNIVPAGTRLGMFRTDLARATGLMEARVVASCSHDLAAALTGLPVVNGEPWAFLQLGTNSVLGNSIVRPIINDDSRELNFGNTPAPCGDNYFHTRTVGLRILQECRQYWKAHDRELDGDVLMHLAACAEPFESLINPADQRFLTPGDMPLKIQAFCNETGQPVPRKPGAVLRCVLESLALYYRKTLLDLRHLTGRNITKLFLFGDTSNSLLNHFTANALEVPVVVATPETRTIGNVLMQALAVGHITSFDELQDIARRAFAPETITPRAGIWSGAYERFVQLDMKESEMAVA